MKTSKSTVKVIRDGAYSISLKRSLILNEIITTSKAIADIWIRQGLVEKVKPSTTN